MIERGEGAYVWDSEGKRYLDGLAGLFVVQAGHGRREIAEAAASQAEKLGYFPLWSYAHPAAIELAARLADLAPGDLNRVFFTTGGAEAVESAWKLARQYFLALGQPERVKVISRHTAYHGATIGALNITGLDAIKEPFLPLLNGLGRNVPNTLEAQRADPDDPLAGADAIEAMIIAEGPETVAAVYLEPVQNAGGCLVPPDGYFQRVREICDRHGVLLVSDEVICAFGRLGDWFGASRLGYQPDMLTFAKGLTSGYAPLGGVLVSDRLAEPFLDRRQLLPPRHHLRRPPGQLRRGAGQPRRDGGARTSPVGCWASRTSSAPRSTRLTDLPIVREVRGMGYFYGIELTKNGTDFSDDECDWLIRGFLSNRLLELGLICRADDRGDPVIQLSPSLVAGPEEFDTISSTLHQVLLEAWKELDR